MSKQIIFLGDSHGYWQHSLYPWMHTIGSEIDTFHVGDVGIGFGRGTDAADFDDIFADYQNLRIIRGNHDNPSEIKDSSHYIEDGTVENGMMFIGGAYSIDKDYRTPGLDWWEDEQLSYQELDQMIDRYLEAKPHVMVTHEPPESIMKYFRNLMPISSRTRDAFQSMFDRHKPKLWVFGHLHQPLDITVDGCRFICVDQYQAIQVEI